MKRKRSKSSRRANLEISIRRIANGTQPRKVNSPVHLLVDGRIRRVTAQSYQDMLDEIEGLEYFAGESMPPPCRIG